VLHHEWSLLIIGFVFMMETLSVIIQVTSFHFFKKRIFLMTPIHHSFEKGGLTGNTDKPWNEWQVNFFFWGIGLVMAVIYLLIWFY
jgi:phospho-N-acetylmuramoyl-pentapeptide-transferase